MFQPQPALGVGAGMSPVPSPPMPSSPNYQQQAALQEQHLGNLYQHLQRLQLQQSPTVSPVTVPIGYPTSVPSPPTLSLVQQNRASPPSNTFSPLLTHSKSADSSPVAPAPAFPLYLTQQQQRASPPPNFQNLTIIKEDATDKDNVDDSLSDEELKKKYQQYPQISITDTHGLVTTVANPILEDSMITEHPTVDDDITATTKQSTSANLLSYFGNHDSSAHSSSYIKHYGTYESVGQYHALNLANIPVDKDGMEVDLVSPTMPLADIYHNYPTMLFSTALGHDIYSNLVDTQNLLLNQQGLQGLTSTSLGMPSGASARSKIPTPMGSAGSSPDFDSHQDAVIASDGLNHLPSMDRPPPHLDNINALNLHNGLADMQQNLGMSLPIHFSSQKPMSDILKEIKRALDNQNPDLFYEHADNRFRLENSGVQIEMEVCQGVVERSVQFRKLSGDPWQFHKLCNELMACMQL